MSGYLRNQRRKGYPAQRARLRRSLRDVGENFRILGRAASDASDRLRDFTAAFTAAGWYGTDDPRNEPADSYPGRTA